MLASPPKIGYAVMLERFPPVEAVELEALAEQHGFTGVMAADHFQPWTPQQGQACFVWNVLSALGQITTGDLGTGVTAPTFRWHPAVIAQASATLAAMYPGRHWLGLGSGEAINEHVVGQYWPEAPERINRMFEAVEIIKKLFASGLAGRDVRHEGQYYRLESTRLWTMPDVAPEILVAAGGPVTAKRAGRTVDGLITEHAPIDKVAPLLQRFNEGAREVGRDADRCPRSCACTSAGRRPTRKPRERHPGVAEWRDAVSAGRHPLAVRVRAAREAGAPRGLRGRMPVSADPDVHRAYIQRYLDLGFDRIYLHNVGRNQREWLDVFGRDVLPGLTR